jgi:hypothetical protein
MNRIDKLNLVKSMLYCLQLIVSNKNVAYKFSDYLIVDDFSALLLNHLFNLNYEVSNYLENDTFPFELIERDKKRITQILLASDDESILEVFDSFEVLLETNSEFEDYCLYVILVGIDSIHSKNQLHNALREYQFDYFLYGLEDVIDKIFRLRISETIDQYVESIKTESGKLGLLLNVQSDLMDKLMIMLSNQHNFLSSSPTIFPQTSREYYENTSHDKYEILDETVYSDIIVVLNGYSRHKLGARYSLGAVYSFIRNVWIREEIEIDIVPHKAQKILVEHIFNDLKHHFDTKDFEMLERLINAVICEAFLRLNVDINLYE